MKELFHFNAFPTTKSRVLEKLIDLHLAKKFSPFYGTLWCIKVFTYSPPLVPVLGHMYLTIFP
jgi:hypothetical protein